MHRPVPTRCLDTLGLPGGLIPGLTAANDTLVGSGWMTTLPLIWNRPEDGKRNTAESGQKDLHGDRGRDQKKLAVSSSDEHGSRSWALSSRAASGQKDHERRGIVRVGRYLKKQASGAGVTRVGSGQGWILLREAFISLPAPILFPDCHYTPNDSLCQVAHRRAACAARRHTSPCRPSANSFIRVFPAVHTVTSEYPPHASRLTCWYLTRFPNSGRCDTGEAGAHQPSTPGSQPAPTHNLARAATQCPMRLARALA